MFPALPLSIIAFFILTTIAALIWFYKILANVSKTTAKNFVHISIIWLVFQMWLAINDVYLNGVNTMPPKIVLYGIIPAFIIIAIILILPSGRAFFSQVSAMKLIQFHIIRIPIELTLFWLYGHKIVPKIMTFSGLNFDIIAGIAALLITLYYNFIGRIKRRVLIVFNVVSLLLLINILTIAALSIQSPIQKFGITDPNVAVLGFPFCWLPVYLVPLVLISHIGSLWKLAHAPVNRPEKKQAE
jgi:hypothetical protein